MFFSFRTARKAVRLGKEVSTHQHDSLLAAGPRKHESRRWGMWFPPGAADKTAVTVGAQRKFKPYPSKVRVHPLVVEGVRQNGLRSVATQTDKPGTQTKATQLAGAAHGGRISQRKQAGKPFQPWQKCASTQVGFLSKKLRTTEVAKAPKVRSKALRPNAFRDIFPQLRDDLLSELDCLFPIGDRYRNREVSLALEVASCSKDAPNMPRRKSERSLTLQPLPTTKLDLSGIVGSRSFAQRVQFGLSPEAMSSEGPVIGSGKPAQLQSWSNWFWNTLAPGYTRDFAQNYSRSRTRLVMGLPVTQPDAAIIAKTPTSLDGGVVPSTRPKLLPCPSPATLDEFIGGGGSDNQNWWTSTTNSVPDSFWEGTHASQLNLDGAGD